MARAGCKEHAIVIEDDPAIRGLLHDVLDQAGFAVSAVGDGVAGLELAASAPPAISLVDINLPGIDGFETVRRLRPLTDGYIALVSALSEAENAPLGRAAGADDYIVKPFRVREFRARLDNIMRTERPARAVAPAEPPRHQARVLRHRDLELDTGARTVTVAGSPVFVAQPEFDLLHGLLEAGQVVRNKHDLALIARGTTADAHQHVTADDRAAVDTRIAELRRRIGDLDGTRYIETVRGIGYRLTPNDR